MKRIIFLLFVLLTTSFPLLASTKITLFTFGNFNDLLDLSSNRGNLATLATLLTEEKERAQHSFTFLNGNILSPHFLAVSDQSNLLIDILNEMPLDLAAIGPHDWDFGVELLKERIADSRFEWITSNILQRGGSPIVKNETKIYEIDGIKMGVFALSTPFERVSKRESELYFLSTLHAAKQKCQELKKANVDLIVALSNQPIEEDRKIIQEVFGIDLLLGRADRESMTWMENKTLIHKMGSRDVGLTRIDLVVEKKIHRSNQKELRIYPSFRYLDHRKKPKNELVLKKLEQYSNLLEEELDLPIATLHRAMDSRFERIRSGESTVGNLMADAALSYFGADGAIVLSELIGGDRYYPAGAKLTKKDIYKELLFGSHLVLVELSGQSLIDALEEGLSSVEKKVGLFPQVSGLSFTFDVRKPQGSRVERVKIQGEDLQREKNYRIAMGESLFENLQESFALQKGKILEGSQKEIALSKVVIEYLQKKKTIEPSFQARILGSASGSIW
jgi:5'-nucleotidase / UDP-sugar diphosphatase